MRPRHYTAENEEVGYFNAINERASMRPRHYTAENLDWLVEGLRAYRELQ